MEDTQVSAQERAALAFVIMADDGYIWAERHTALLLCFAVSNWLWEPRKVTGRDADASAARLRKDLILR